MRSCGRRAHAVRATRLVARRRCRTSHEPADRQPEPEARQAGPDRPRNARCAPVRGEASGGRLGTAGDRAGAQRRAASGTAPEQRRGRRSRAGPAARQRLAARGRAAPGGTCRRSPAERRRARWGARGGGTSGTARADAGGRADRGSGRSPARARRDARAGAAGAGRSTRPTSPSRAPRATSPPARTASEPSCWYVATTAPQRTLTVSPPRGTRPAKLTRPRHALRTGEPRAAARSTPRCQPPAYAVSAQREGAQERAVDGALPRRRACAAGARRSSRTTTKQGATKSTLPTVRPARPDQPGRARFVAKSRANWHEASDARAPEVSALRRRPRTACGRRARSTRPPRGARDRAA